HPRPDHEDHHIHLARRGPVLDGPMPNDLSSRELRPMNLRSRRRQTGQALVLFGVGLVAIVAMVGLIIDGGNAYAQQRTTQNGSDAAAEGGATLLARNVMSGAVGGVVQTPAQLDSAVLAAANREANAHGLQP